MERVWGVWRLARDWWQQAARAQRLLVAGSALLLLVSVGLGLYLNQARYVAVPLGLTPTEVTAVLAKLNEMQVPYRLSEGGNTVFVPAEQRLPAGLAVSQSGFPASGAVGLELFSEPRFGATDFERRVNYLRAQQGELERAILRMAKVAYANVKVAMPEPSPFIRDEKPVTAAVLVQTRPSQNLTRTEVQGIVGFLSRAVQGLKPENVTVVDHLGRTLTGDIDDGVLGSSLAMDQEQQRIGLQQELQTRVQRLLEPLFGSGNVVAQVNVRLNTEETRVESRTVLPGAPSAEQDTRETGGRLPNTAEGPPVYQGVAVAGAAGAAGASDLLKTQTSTQYQLSERREVSAQRPGGIKEVSIGVAINRTDLAPEQVRQVQEMVAAAVGAVPERIAVTSIPFSSPVGERGIGLAAASGGGAASASAPAAVPAPAQAPANWLAMGLGLALVLAAAAPWLRRWLPGLLAAPTPAPAGMTVLRAVPAGGAAHRSQVAAVSAVPPPESPDAKLEKEVANLVDDNPEASAAMLRGWIRG